MRAFALATLLDDAGTAMSAWAGALIMTTLFRTQRDRASLMLPTLCAFLLGTVVAGPLADWASRTSLQHLARWRWRLVVWDVLLRVVLVLYLAGALALPPVTLGALLPFMLGGAFLKTALRPTQGAFFVDLLTHESDQLDADGAPRRDERGAVLRYKTHLLTMSSLTSALTAAGAVVGLIIGGRVLAASGGRPHLLFLAMAAAHLGYAAIVFFGCHPQRTARSVRVVELVRDLGDGEGGGKHEGEGERVGESVGVGVSKREGEGESAGKAGAGGARGAVRVMRHFVGSLRDGVRFLAAPAQRPLAWLLVGCFLVEVVTEAYDGKMIVKHVLGGSDDAVRHSELAWTVGRMCVLALVPMLARWVGGIGRLFMLSMLVDGAVIALAGRIAGAEGPAAIVPFAVVIGFDHALTDTSTSLADLAQNSASSAAMRGRIAATYAFFVIVGDIAAEALATTVSERVGIPGMLARLGLMQIGVVVVLMVVGGRRLWRFGIRAVRVEAAAVDVGVAVPSE